MKRNSLLVLCLSLSLLYIDLSDAKRGGGSFGRSFSFKKILTPKHGSTHTVKDSSPGAQPKQPAGYPRRSGRPGYLGGRGNSTYGRTEDYIYHNPNNKVLSPHYGGSFGYGGYGVGGGSPYSKFVQSMGMYPTYKSRGYGRSAVMAAAGGVMAGMALGYGLGRFPRPHFSFHSPQEEYYYNHYMYRKYGVKSTDTNDYSRDYTYTQAPLTYNDFKRSCMMDVPPVENQNKKTGAASSDGEDNDTVSVVEIGYPALIEQLKARICLGLYMDYSERYFKRVAGGVQGLQMGLQGLLAIVTSTLLLLH